MLVALESYSQAEAAQILGISEKAVETRIYRARNSLKEKFEKF
ncbi:sigma-24 (FecI-like) [Novosphingobium pentaromativorans US6-1]|uniref:Sigma-24 (FecI-like) n=1 Tax=Novosphingobium pentaromativorans US6-1 TaxID=1088721 RepID=G6EF88_9SPHN|nr:sigma-24 (FecI-like) [Novosphingobium pentaromativorans US6-1]